MNDLIALMAFTSAAIGLDDPGASPSFSYSDAESYFSQGAAPVVDQLPGRWFEVANVELAGFRDSTNIAGYDPNGLKNTDGSVTEMIFSQEKSFDGRTIDVVQMNNLGGAQYNQGPNEVVVDGQSAVFTQWAYAGLNTSMAGHFDRTCRFLKATTDKMVCAMILHVDIPGEVAPVTKQYDGKTVYYAGFFRKAS